MRENDIDHHIAFPSSSDAMIIFKTNITCKNGILVYTLYWVLMYESDVHFYMLFVVILYQKDLQYFLLE